MFNPFLIGTVFAAVSVAMTFICWRATNHNDYRPDKKKIRGEWTRYFAFTLFLLLALLHAGLQVDPNTILFRAIITISAIGLGLINAVYAVSWLVHWPAHGEKVGRELFAEAIGKDD